MTAQSSKDPAAIQKWSLNGPILESQLQTAWNNRVAAGNTNEIEQALGILSTIGAGSPAFKFSTLQNTFNSSTRKDSLGQTYYPTPYVPLGLFSDPMYGDAWTRFTYDSTETSSYQVEARANIGGQTGDFFKFFSKLGFSIGGGMEAYTETKFVESHSEKYKIEFDLIQVPLRRNWWNADVLVAPYWKWNALQDQRPLSLGQVPAPPNSCRMPVYPVTALVVRNVRLSTADTALARAQQSATADTSLTVGPFTVQADGVQQQDGAQTPGMALIGLVCHIVPKAPNPNF